MGMKCNFMVASRSNPAERLHALPDLDVAGSDALATSILGSRSWGRSRRSHRTGDLSIDVYPKDGEIAVAVYGDLAIVASDDVLSWFEHAPDAWGETLINGYDVDVFVLHSVVDMGCFGSWRGGTATRLFGGSSDDGVIVDVGERLPFETGLDSDGEDFGWITENAILDRLGYCYEGPSSPNNVDPQTVPLLVYR